MVDWWDYLEHGVKAKERKDHKYIARIETGTKNGKNTYRYFYTKADYEAYLKAQKDVSFDKATVDEVAELMRKKRIDINSIKNFHGVDKTSSGWVGIRYMDTNGVNYSIYDKTTKLDKLRNRLGDKMVSAKKFVTDAVKKVVSDAKLALAKRKGKDFVDSVMKDNPESNANKTTAEEKEYRTSDVGVRARSHTYKYKIELPNGKHRYFYSEEDYQRYIARQEYQKNSPDFMKDVPRQDTVYTDESRADSMAEINEDYDYWDSQRSQNCMYCTTAYELRQRGYDVQAADRGTDDEYEGNVRDLSKWYENPQYMATDKNGNVIDATYYYKADCDYLRSIKVLKPIADKAKAEYETAYENATWFEKAFGSEDLKTKKAAYDKAQNEYLTLRDDAINRKSSKEYESIEKSIYEIRVDPYTGQQVFDVVKKASPKNSRGNLMVEWNGGGGHSMIYEVDNYGNVTIRDAQTNMVYQPIDLDDAVMSIKLVRTDNLDLKPGILKTVEAN